MISADAAVRKRWGTVKCTCEKHKGECKMESELLSLCITEDNYYQITSRKGGNKGKLLHRLIMEQHLGRKLKREEEIHHLNGNRLDNRIENLVLCKNHKEHIEKYHPHRSEETKRKISNSRMGEKHWNYGKPMAEETKLKMKNTYAKKNKCGFPNLIVTSCNECVRGFTFKYRYYDENGVRKGISHSKLEDMIQAIIDKGQFPFISNGEKFSRVVALDKGLMTFEEFKNGC